MIPRVLILLIACLATVAPTCAQRNCPAAVMASERLKDALLYRDTLAIKGLVHSEIAYGHSNGWAETRSEMIRDLYDGTLSYYEIRPLEQASCTLHHNAAIIRQRVSVQVDMNGTRLQMNLGVLQVWEWHFKQWTLIARQSCKIS